MKHPKVILVVNRSSARAARLADRLIPWIRRHASVVAVVNSEDAPIPDLPAHYLFAFGGDGTLLSVAQRLAGRKTPVAGINLGRVGYLADIDPAGARAGIADILAGRGQTTERLMLDVLVRRKGVITSRHTALNDALLQRDTLSAMATLTLDIAGVRVGEFVGDGIVVSTPTGATGYALSAGGPVMSGSLRALILTPLLAHSLLTRPLVVDADQEVVIHWASRTPPLHLIVDGRRHERLERGDVVTVRRSKRTFILVSPSHIKPFFAICDKLRWGRSVKARNGSTSSHSSF